LPRPRLSALLRMEMTGVMPLPPANSRKSSSTDVGQNTPAGASTSTVIPGRSEAQTQLEPYPPSVRLTVTCTRFSCGALDSE
jgi:hypothetical protein